MSAPLHLCLVRNDLLIVRKGFENKTTEFGNQIETSSTLNAVFEVGCNLLFREVGL